MFRYALLIYVQIRAVGAWYIHNALLAIKHKLLVQICAVGLCFRYALLVLKHKLLAIKHKLLVDVQICAVGA